MSKEVSWLPSSALGDARTAEPVVGALDEWCAKWLAADALTAPPRWDSSEGTNCSTGFHTLGQGKAYRLAVRESTMLDLAGLLLGREIGERERRTRQDRRVIEHLVDTALADLLKRLDETVQAVADAETREWFVLPLNDNRSTTLLRIEATRPVLVALVRGWSGLPRHGPSLPSKRVALADQPLTLSARIGTSRLTLAEIEALGIGDVLTLDTPLAAPLPVCIDGRLASREALSLAATDENLKLQIERPARQW